MLPFRPYFFLPALILFVGGCNPGNKAFLSRDEAKVISPSAQETKFEADIAAMEQAEIDSPSTPGTIVFTGSSSFTRWKTLQHDMAPVPVLNRGFGGSGIRQVSYYAPRIVLPVKPKAIFFYCGENDICNDHTDHRQPLRDFQDFVTIIRRHLPDTRIIYIGMKPSPKRWQYWPKFQEANKLIEGFTREERGLRYVDVAPVMLDSLGMPKRGIWVSDSLHMNEKGYAEWTALLKPIVMEENARN